jgi:hypothetical protein
MRALAHLTLRNQYSTFRNHACPDTCSAILVAVPPPESWNGGGGQASHTINRTPHVARVPRGDVRTPGGPPTGGACRFEGRDRDA